jgi:hypothetical protein
MWVLVGDMLAESDGTVRDERGRIVQFMYGGDGFSSIKVMNVQRDLPPQFVNVASEAKTIRTESGLSEFESNV